MSIGSNGNTKAKTGLKNYGNNGSMDAKDRARMLSGGSNGLSGGLVAPGTDKIKKNGRKLNSGVPGKILIGRNGPNIVI